MAEVSRYRVSKKGAGVVEGALENKLNIQDEERLSNMETSLLEDAYEYFLSKKTKYNVDLILEIHHYFLKTLYSWAGELRTVDISKSNMMFASCRFLAELLKQFDQQILEHMPNAKDSKQQAAEKLAFIHNEYNAIHPFRDGNGRTIRLFLDLIAINSGYDFIDYDTSTKKTYFDACKAGMIGNNKPMEKLIGKGLQKRQE